MSPSVDPQVANFNPTAFALENQQKQANLATTQQQQQLRQQEIGLTQQQVQGEQLKNQITQQALRDSQALTQAYSQYDSKSPTAADDLERNFIVAGGSGKGLMDLKAAQLDWQAKIQGLDKGRLEINDTITKRTADAFQAYKEQITKNPAQALQLWAQEYGPRIQELHPDQKIDFNNPPVGADLDAKIGVTAHLNDMIENRLKEQQTKTSAAEAGKAQAETAAKELETQLEQNQLELLKSWRAHPEDLNQRIAQSIDPNKYPEEFQAARNEAQLAPTYKDAVAAIEKHGQNVREREKTLAVELDPQVAALRKKQEEDRQNHANALQQGDTATAKYFESAQDVHQTLAAARSIEHIVELARGNPIAGNQLELIVPEFTAAMQGIKPRGMQLNEKGFSSTWDRVMNEVQSAQPGKSSIGASTLNQIMPYIKTIANGAVQNHNATTQTVNQVYRKSFPLEPTPYQDTKNPTTAGVQPRQARKIGDRVTLKGGQTVTVTAVHPDGSFDAQ